MEILDIHTHHLYKNPAQAIVNRMPWHFLPDSEGYFSVGFHPWYLTEDGSEDWDTFQEYVSLPQVLAIGESGLDKLSSVNMDIQEKAFLKQAEIASSINKPLIIHCVKAYNEIIRYKMDINPEVAWIIHGFRGKKELASQLLDHGFYLSFGEKYQEDALKATPLDKLLIETDESEVGIYELYKRASEYLEIETNEFIKKVQENIQNIFLGS